jgi:hypothetical protein
MEALILPPLFYIKTIEKTPYCIIFHFIKGYYYSWNKVSFYHHSKQPLGDDLEWRFIIW